MIQASEAVKVLADERSLQLEKLEAKHSDAVSATAALQERLAAAEAAAALLEEREAALRAAEARLSLLEAEEGRIEELEELLKEKEREREEGRAVVEAAKGWEAKHKEALELVARKESFTATLAAEKDEIEKRAYEADLKLTRLQTELLSSKKALRQAVNQLQALELEAEQERVAVQVKPKKNGAAGGADGGAGRGAGLPPRAVGPSPKPAATHDVNTPSWMTPGASASVRGASSSSSSSSSSSIPVDPNAPGWHTPTSASSATAPPLMTVGERVHRIRDRMQELVKTVRTQ